MCALSQVQFEVADATRRMFSECSFDVIYSRDTILHIDNKPALFKRFHVSISEIWGWVFLVTFQGIAKSPSLFSSHG